MTGMLEPRMRRERNDWMLELGTRNVRMEGKDL